MKSTILEFAQTLTGWIELSILAKATIILLLGLSAVVLARCARASLRHLLLAVTFAALLILPLIAVAAPELKVEFPVSKASDHNFALSATPSPDALKPTINGSANPTTPDISRWPTPSWPTIARSVWIAGAILLLVSLGIDIIRLRRLRRNSLPSLKMGETARILAKECGISRKVDVLLHEGIATPLTCGTWHPVIVLPWDARNWSEADLRRALVHELEHVRRADWVVQLAARVACAFYWFHPLAWVAWRRLCLEAERACDDAVIRSAEPVEYAEQLVSLARQASRTHSHLALGLANRSELSTRVSALLDGSQRRGRAGLLAAATVMCAASLIIVVIAPLRAVGQSKNSTRDRIIELEAKSEIEKSESATGLPVKEAAESGDPKSAAPTNPSLPPTAATKESASTDRDTKRQRSTPLDEALLEAAESGEISVINRLLDAGANVNCAIDGDGSPLIVAAREGQLSAVRVLLDRGADPNLAVSGDGNPLIMAAREGHTQIVELLLDRGANVDQIVPDDENALIQASREGHLPIVKLLVSHGADVNVRIWAERAFERPSGEWRTPLSMARKGGHTAVVSFLISAGARE